MEIPMSYCHLPASIDEYCNIIKSLNTNMTNEELDYAIKDIKGIKQTRRHYRIHLKNLGLIKENNGKILLPACVEEFKKNKINLKELLLCVSKRNEEVMFLMKIINSVIGFNYNKPITLIGREIKRLYNPPRKAQEITRALRYIKLLGEYIELIPDDGYAYFLRVCQDIVFDQVGYNHSFPLEKLKEMLYEWDKRFEKKGFKHYLSRMQRDKDLRYRIAFITFPEWSTLFKGIELSGEYYTHLKIYGSLLERKEDE